MKEKKKIAVLSGGPGSEREISKASAKSVVPALLENFTDVYEVDVKGKKIKLETGTDLAFIMIHGTFGEDGQIQEILTKLGVPFTGAGIEASKIAFDKIASKRIFVRNKVSTPNYITLSLKDYKRRGIEQWQEIRASENLPDFPFVAKPPREGSSVGVHIVKSSDEVNDAMKDIFSYDNQALIEEFIEGRELTVGVLDGDALPIVEIQPTDGFYDIKNKYPWLTGEGKTNYLCPAPLDDKTTKKVQDLALSAYNSIECEIYARVDVLVSKKNKPYVLEVNTIPGMTESSLLPKSANEVGISFPELCKRIADISLQRSSN